MTLSIGTDAVPHDTKQRSANALTRGVLRLATALLVSLSALTFEAHEVSADGIFLWRNEKIDIIEPEQKAIVISDKGWEDLILEVKYEGGADTFGWIVPLPSRPIMSTSSPTIFEHLSAVSQNPSYGMSRDGYDLQATKGIALGAGAVDVLERRRVGIYDTVVLATDSGRALRRWISDNAFRLPSRAEPVLDDYAKRGWVFVAMTINPAAHDSATETRLETGRIQPIRFRFQVAEPVFPLTISSINGDPSDILLYVMASDHLVVRGTPAGRWESRMCGPVPQLQFVDPDSFYSTDGDPDFSVAKLRARLKPAEMKDVYFEKFDPVPGLRSKDLERRAESVSCLGWSRDPAGTTLLVKFLDDRRRQSLDGLADVPALGSTASLLWQGQDILSALWALGQIGSPDAIPTLISWAAAPAPAPSVEALASLKSMGTREAIAPCLEIVARPPRRDDDPSEQYARERAWEILTMMGDSTYLAEVSALPDRGASHRPGEPQLSPRTAALAACGDSAACRQIVGSVILGSSTTAFDAIDHEARQGGNLNGFPMGFWIGAELVTSIEIRPWLWWNSLSGVMERLDGRPALRDSLLRVAAADERVPDAGRALLFGCLESPRDVDRVALSDIWQRSLELPITPVRLHGPDGEDDYNLLASICVYSFTRWRDADSLRRLLATTPATPSSLRADLAWALATCGQVEDVDAVASAIGQAWNVKSRSRYRASFAASDSLFDASTVPSIPKHPLPMKVRRGYVHLKELDIYHRKIRIPAYLLASSEGSRRFLAEICNESNHPFVRLTWIDLAVHGSGFDDQIINQLQPALSQLRSEAPAGGRLIMYLDQVERSIARRRVLIEDGTILGTSVKAR